MNQVKFTREFWQEWRKNPQQAAKKYGINWSELDQEWQNRDWQHVSMNEFEKLWRKSKWAGWFDWSA